MASSKNLIVVVCATIILVNQIEPSVFRQRCYGDGEKFAVLRNKPEKLKDRWADDLYDLQFIQGTSEIGDRSGQRNPMAISIEQICVWLQEILCFQPACLTNNLTEAQSLERSHDLCPMPAKIDLGDRVKSESLAKAPLRRNLCKILAFMRKKNFLLLTFPCGQIIQSDNREQVSLFAQEKTLLENGIYQVNVTFTDDAKLTLHYSQELQQWTCNLPD